MCPFADSRLKEPRFQASSSQQPILSTSMCSITVTRVTHEKGGHGNWSLLSLCPEQDARPGPRPALQRSQGQGPACPQRSRDSAAWAPPGRTGSGHPGDTAGTELAPMGHALTLPCLLLPRQCAAQFAQERLVLLHLGSPRGGRSWWRGGHKRVHATHRRPGSGQEGAAAASPPLPADPEVRVLQLSSSPQRSGTTRVVPGTTGPLL